MSFLESKIRVIRERLSDGSFVYNVIVPTMTVAAESEGAAQRFAEALAELCNEYNVHDDVEVAFGY